MTDPTRFDAIRLWELPQVGHAVASRDGTVVVVAVTTHTAGEESTTVLHRVDPDGSTTPLTAGFGSCTDPALSPSGALLAFVREVEGRRQAHVVPTVGGGSPRRLTSLPADVLGSPAWVDEHRLLVVTTLWSSDPSLDATAAWVQRREDGPPVHATQRRVNRVWDTWHEDDATQHVLMMDVRDGDPAVIDLTPGDWLLPDPLDDPGRHVAVSPDGRLLAFTTAAAAGDEDGLPVPHLRTVGLDGGDVADLTPDATGPVGPPSFLPDGRILVTIARERDFYAAQRDLWAVDPEDAGRELVLEAAFGFDDVVVDDDGRVVVGTTLAGRGCLVEVVDGGTRRLAKDAVGSLGRPVATTGGLFAVASSLLEPPELVRVDDQQVTTLTSFARPLVADLDLGRPEERVVTGARGDDVQVLLLHPPAAAVDGVGPPPLVHLLHGGPHGTFGDEWHWRWNAAVLAAQGWVIALVNFHGSTGVDHEFTRSIHGDWPTLPTRDVLRATDVLVADGTVDGERLAVAGGSYGGYLATWLCSTTDRFAAAVAHAAVTDVTGMWASDWPSSLAGAFGGRPWEDPSVLERSPSSRYGRIDTPMLVTHGGRDLRVPIDQGRALYGVLRERGVETRLVVFPDENHWVLGRAASQRWYAEMIDWLDRFLDRDG